MQRAATTIVIMTLVLTSLTAALSGDVTKTNETLLRATSPLEDLVDLVEGHFSRRQQAGGNSVLERN